MRLLRAFELVDRLEAAAATARNGPIEMDQQSEVGKRPESAPIAVWRIAARENVKAQRRGQQGDARPNGEYDQIVEGVGIGVQVLLQHGGTVRDRHRNHKHSACEGKNCSCRSVKLVWLAHRSQLHAISRTTTTRIVARPGGRALASSFKLECAISFQSREACAFFGLLSRSQHSA